MHELCSSFVVYQSTLPACSKPICRWSVSHYPDNVDDDVNCNRQPGDGDLKKSIKIKTIEWKDDMPHDDAGEW